MEMIGPQSNKYYKHQVPIISHNNGHVFSVKVNNKQQQHICLLLLSFFLWWWCFVYLEYRQKTLTKSIKIASGLWSQWIIVKSGAKNLHSQKGKDAHEQKEQDQKWGNRFDTVDQGGEQLGQWFPMPETQHWWCSQGVHISKYFKLVMMDRVYTRHLIFM